MDDSGFQQPDIWPTGTVVGGRYRIVRELGAGGFAITYLAECVNGGGFRVLKRLHEQFARLKDFPRRLEREAHALAKLRGCPYVVDVYGLEILDRRLVLVMGYVDGEPLAVYLSAGGLATAQAVGIAVQLALGLKAIHERGLLHRDLKPANILLPKDDCGLPRATIIDFGLAVDPSGTRTTFCAGSAGYAPPEQYVLTQENQDQRLDLFSLGATLYFMLAGRKAYNCDVLVPEQPVPEPPLTTDSDWPGLNDLVIGLIQPNRESRKPLSAEEILRAFGEIVEVRLEPFAEKVKRAMVEARTLSRSRAYLDAARIIEKALDSRPELPFTLEPQTWETLARDLVRAVRAADSNCVAEIEELALLHQGRALGSLLDEIKKQLWRDQLVQDFRDALKSGLWERGLTLLEEISGEPECDTLFDELKRDLDSALVPALDLAADLVTRRDYVAAIAGLPKFPVDTIMTRAAEAARLAAEYAEQGLFARAVWALTQHSDLIPVQTMAASLIHESEHPPVLPAKETTANKGTRQQPVLCDGLTYVWIPPGQFLMGAPEDDPDALSNEKPSHSVRIEQGFWIGSTAVTVGTFKRFVSATKRKMPREPNFNAGWKDDSHPIVNVCWRDAVEYCDWAGLRLPTEAEWEYAARAGTEASRHGQLDEIAWHVENSGGEAHRVGLKSPNRFGLYDTLGNVFEWTADWYAEKYQGNTEQVDPKGPQTGVGRVVRGGSWNSGPTHSRLSFRHSHDPESKYVIIGFRCVRDVPRGQP